MRSVVRNAVLDAWAVLAPVECAGCGAPDRTLCDACRAELARGAVSRDVLLRTDGTELPIWHTLEYGGVARNVLLAFKDGGRTDAASSLAAVLRRTVECALASVPPEARGRVQLAGIPSSRAAFRRRGYAPVRLMMARAGYRDARLMHPIRQTQDQSELDATARFANRRESLAVRNRSPRRFVLLVDDIITSGATVLEADRAFRQAGHVVLGGVALARTMRRIPVAERQPEIGRNCP